MEPDRPAPVCPRHNKSMTPVPVVQKGACRGWKCVKCEREWAIYQRTKRRPPHHV